MNNRIQALFERLPAECEAALIKTEQNRFYFLDFDAGDAGLLLLTRKNSWFIIDSRYIEIAKAEVKSAEVVLEDKALNQVKQLLQENNIKSVNVETQITLDYAARVENALDGIEVIKAPLLTDEILALRTIKDEQELARIKKAQEITDACFEHILKFIKPGAREIDLALEMEMFMRKNGSKGIAFNTIFVSGKKTSLPHGEPGDNIICKGDFVTMDFGARVDGYCTDMTRTVAVGEISDEQRRVYDTVLSAQLAACEGIKGGMTGDKADKIARDIITQAGYGECFGHGLGHSLGIDIHENPRYSPAFLGAVPSGTLMTIEPGVYLEGKFGVRIEDTVFVTDNGVEILGKSDKSLIIV